MLQKVNNNVFKQICCWSAAAWSRARAVETVLSQTKHFGMWQMHNQNMCMQQQYKWKHNTREQVHAVYLHGENTVQFWWGDSERHFMNKVLLQECECLPSWQRQQPWWRQVETGAHTWKKSSICCLPCLECLPYVHSNVAMAHKHTHTH